MMLHENAETIARISNAGYIPGIKIGEGFQRRVYEVIRKDEERTICVAKVRKPTEHSDSVQHLVNMQKGDLTQHEIDVLKSMDHPNISEIMDVIETDDAPIVIEPYAYAQSLEDVITQDGPMKSHDRARTIIGKMFSALHYTHVVKGLLHRDIKTSNLLLPYCSNQPILSDWEFAKEISEIESTTLPTRGGTAFTHPQLLNGLFTQDNTRATIQTDLYAMGIVAYQLLTGETPFDYSIVQSSSGNVIPIGNERISVLMRNGDTTIPKITAEIHQQELARALEKVSPEYRPLLSGCLSIHDSPLAGTTEQCYDALLNLQVKMSISNLWDKSNLAEYAEPAMRTSRTQEDVTALSDKVIERGFSVLKGLHFEHEAKGVDAVVRYVSAMDHVIQGDNYGAVVEETEAMTRTGEWTPRWTHERTQTLRVFTPGPRDIFVAKRTLRKYSHDSFGITQHYRPTPWVVVPRV